MNLAKTFCLMIAFSTSAYAAQDFRCESVYVKGASAKISMLYTTREPKNVSASLVKSMSLVADYNTGDSSLFDLTFYGANSHFLGTIKMSCYQGRCEKDYLKVEIKNHQLKLSGSADLLAIDCQWVVQK